MDGQPDGQLGQVRSRGSAIPSELVDRGLGQFPSLRDGNWKPIPLAMADLPASEGFRPRANDV